ncbi:MAG: DUF2750 domain-containing protein [Desulfopila sp.]|nr:DUF2750 domain-containing protein [Desulfopila sp.]
MKSTTTPSFYREIRETQHVWAMQSNGALVSYDSEDGIKGIYLWSSRDQVSKAIQAEVQFKNFQPLEIPLIYLELLVTEQLNDQKCVFLLNWIGNTKMVWEENKEEFLENLMKSIKKLK